MKVQNFNFIQIKEPNRRNQVHTRHQSYLNWVNWHSDARQTLQTSFHLLSPSLKCIALRARKGKPPCPLLLQASPLPPLSTISTSLSNYTTTIKFNESTKLQFHSNQRTKSQKPSIKTSNYRRIKLRVCGRGGGSRRSVGRCRGLQWRRRNSSRCSVSQWVSSRWVGVGVF